VTVPKLRVWTEWYCPNCKATSRTTNKGPHTRYHTCPSNGMLSAPMVPVGTKAKVEAHEREDYEGKDSGRVFLDVNGRPIMNIETTRDDGTDLIVFAPTATGGAS
jgi:hypothetical protein